MKAQKWVLSKKLKGTVDLSFFRKEDEDITTDLSDGEVMIEAVYSSVDPYMRPYAERVLSEGDTMMGEQVARILSSKHAAFKEGELVLANVGWRTVTKVTKISLVRKVPELASLPLYEALGMMGITGLTAYYGLVEVCDLRGGEVVVVSAAAGAVGSVAGQIAKIKGCKVIGICGSDKKCDWITKELGMDIAINYKTDDVDTKLKMAAPDGIDCFFDNVGGDISTTVLFNMKLRGRVAISGAISMYNDPIDTPSLGKQPYRAIVYKQLRVEGFNVLRWFKKWPEANSQLLAWIQEEKLKSRGTVFDGFEKIPEAFLALFEGQNFGKTVVKIKE